MSRDFATIPPRAKFGSENAAAVALLSIRSLADIFTAGVEYCRFILRDLFVLYINKIASFVHTDHTSSLYSTQLLYKQAALIFELPVY